MSLSQPELHLSVTFGDGRKSQPLVSAMMPAYNAEQHIGTAIESILAQTFGDWELIVVDDGSTDDTSRIATQFDDPRVHVFRLAQNTGRGQARNVALANCQGRYIAICDADDISLPERFAVQTHRLENDRSLGIVSSQLLYFDVDSTPSITFASPESDDEIRRRFARGHCAVPNAAAMISRSVFDACGPYNPEFRRAQDYEFFLRALSATRFLTLQTPLVMYRQRRNALTFKYWKETVNFQRYASYLHSDQKDASDTSICSFISQRSERVYMGTVGSVRYGYLKARQLLHRSWRLR